MDVHERWRLASDGDRFSRFRRRDPVLLGLTAAAVAVLTLTLFFVFERLGLGKLWGSALLTIVTNMIGGYLFALLCNHRAKSAYVAEFHRLNKTPQH